MGKRIVSKTPRGRCAYPQLQNALEDLGYKQMELAKELGVAQSTIAGLTFGDREPTIQMLMRLETITGLTFRELFEECVSGRRR